LSFQGEFTEELFEICNFKKAGLALQSMIATAYSLSCIVLQLSITELKGELDKLLSWLVPVASNTTKYASSMAQRSLVFCNIPSIMFYMLALTSHCRGLK